MKCILFSVCLLFTLNAVAQHHPVGSDVDQEKQDLAPPPVYNYVEQMPAPDYDIAKYLSEHLKYPDVAFAANIQGKVVLKFIVNEDGSISDCKVEQGIGGGCDEEAVRVITGMPKWKAGIHNGVPVKVWYTLPIYIDPE